LGCGAGSALHASAAATFTITTAATEEHDLIGDYFCGVTLVAIFVIVAASLDAAFDVDLLAFGEVLGNAFVLEENDVGPIGFVLPLACGVVLDAAGGGDGKLTDCRALGGELCFGVFAEIADENNLIDAACHTVIS